MNEGFSIQIENMGASKALWKATQSIIGELGDVQIHCGNCKFTGDEWLEVLKIRK